MAGQGPAHSSKAPFKRAVPADARPKRTLAQKRQGDPSNCLRDVKAKVGSTRKRQGDPSNCLRDVKAKVGSTQKRHDPSSCPRDGKAKVSSKKGDKRDNKVGEKTRKVPAGLKAMYLRMNASKKSASTSVVRQRAKLGGIGRYAITFGEVAILHVGGEEIGEGRREAGISVAALRDLQTRLRKQGHVADLFTLSDALPEDIRSNHEAATLVVRAGADVLLGKGSSDGLLKEQARTKYDTVYWDAKKKNNRGENGILLNKRARHNIVFGDLPKDSLQTFKHAGDTSSSGKGNPTSRDFVIEATDTLFTTKAFCNLPLLSRLRASLPTWLGKPVQSLNAEGNHYFEAKSGIGFHGDAERKIVICLSLGEPSALRYMWRCPERGLSFETPPIDIEVRHGDIYIMSEKATGFDWRSRSKVRVVHAAGHAKYLAKKKKKK